MRETMSIKIFYKLYLVPDIFIDQQCTVEEVHQCRLKRNCVHEKVRYLTDLFIRNRQMIEICHCESTYATDKLTFCVFLFVSLMCPFSPLAEINLMVYLLHTLFFAFLSFKMIPFYLIYSYIHYYFRYTPIKTF